MSPDRALTDRLITDADGAERWPFHGPRSIHAHITRPVVQQLVAADAHRVLDLGCGNGWFSGALERCGFDMTGLDDDAAGLREARDRYPEVRFIAGDAIASERPVWPHSFDAVVAIDVVDHVARPRRFVETALDALRRGGLLVVTTTYHGYAKNLALALAGRFDRRWEANSESGRLRFYSRETLLELMSGFALDAVRLETIGRIPMFARAMVFAATKPR